MDKGDQASPAATIVAGIGSRKSLAAPADKSDQQQDNQKDLPSKQSKPESTMQFKETTTSDIDPTIAAIDLTEPNLSEDRYPIGAKNMEGSFREAAQAEIQPLPQQTALNRQRPVSIPGAYSLGGRPNAADNADDTDIVPVPPFAATISAPASNVEDLDDDHLVRANPVQEDPEAPTDLMHANPMNLEERERQQKKRKKQNQTFVFILILVILAGAAIVGTVAGTQKQPDETIGAATPTPTAFLSMEPSDVPSSAPTGALDMLLDSLPDYTLASMNNGSDTPQWKAWQWLANHQNITFLPEWRKTQLFAMATFFYAFEGENWNPLIQERLMDDSVEECDWYSGGFGLFINGQFMPFEDLGLPSIDPAMIMES
ncbi:expressed unknown protein [Seminavis robusta]|uniref:Uncharacterized protein n=1 Tax=Seminavis robusta TaxID=568900 RepID=A0A9N8F088_9STRA|nr:expressed unknown protein [Seminavis robusta]|eukprot:Sro2766_g336661.1  (372) ;mRNA; f:5771-6886